MTDPVLTTRIGTHMYKFEQLEVWQLAIAYADMCYTIAEQLPRQEEYNISSQLRRAAVSVALNIAEGSTGQSDAEQSRFIGMALRSLIETVACQHLIYRRKYISDPLILREAYRASDKLAAKLQAMRRSILGEHKLSEEAEEYDMDSRTPFDMIDRDL
jgi:four helix bundle protein